MMMIDLNYLRVKRICYYLLVYCYVWAYCWV